jgi:hypothetical protein
MFRIPAKPSAISIENLIEWSVEFGPVKFNLPDRLSCRELLQYDSKI